LYHKLLILFTKLTVSPKIIIIIVTKNEKHTNKAKSCAALNKKPPFLRRALFKETG